MTLLEDWRSKKSWGLTLSPCPIYVYKGYEDFDLRVVLKRMNNIELDLESKSGIYGLATAYEGV